MDKMIFKNYSELLQDNLSEKQRKVRELALSCLEEAIKSVEPKNLLRKSLIIQNHTLNIQGNTLDLTKFSKIYIIGGGKASAEMASSLERIITSIDRSIDYEGIINVPEGLEIDHDIKNEKIQYNYASHPIPNQKGINGVKEMLKLIEKSNQNDLIICLISGGGSALLPFPKETITLEDLKRINSLLLKSGASIHEINVIRKHISNFKGGNLAKYVFEKSGALLISLIISDVIRDDLDIIASGPTVPDSSTYSDALKILEKYHLISVTPDSIKAIIQAGIDGFTPENPKKEAECFNNSKNFLIGSISIGVEKIKKKLKNNGYNVKIFSNEISGEAKKFGEELYNLIKNEYNEKQPRKPNKIALIGSGELTVTITGKGIGGRNQEMLVSLLNNFKNNSYKNPFVVIGANLDGIEGNSEAMGALIDNKVLEFVKRNQIDLNKYLNRNDSNSFFKKVATEIVTGPTGCNVNDLVLILLN
ncbi:MAG: DUF4147 domain-containing protein [Candidatus Lokiarchaeota archaeon]|nr:DUF4147 domain-containing protein [Candidatus Lokiarchaeota archaeon]MBD3201808.1 DUF4147 domain-containing protein [Candidatus Lokiarchaeota archaeon]